MVVEIKGSCKCGVVQFSAVDDPIIQLCCHCLNCQTSTGQPNVNIAFFKTKTLEIQGDVGESIYLSDTGNRTSREGCVSCRTVLFDRSNGFPSLIGVIAESISKPFEFSASCHVWTVSRQEGVVIPRNMKRYEKGIV